MVSDTMQKELIITYERLRLAFVVLLFWVVIVTLDIAGAMRLEAVGLNFLVYAILATTSVVLLLVGLVVQSEPLLKVMIKNRKDTSKIWESSEELKPSIDLRKKISEIVQIIAILLMFISLLFVVV
ncbi:MAG: hypothetical protein HGN29_11560 [Asgard group archaeon]|nr:hypothetical protein [Asgard group archaeon]